MKSSKLKYKRYCGLYGKSWNQPRDIYHCAKISHC
jgi:hypothetical protein